MRLLPPDLSSVIRAKLSGSPSNLAGISGKSDDLHKSASLPKSADFVNQFSLSGLHNASQEYSGDVPLPHLLSKSGQTAGQIAALLELLGLPQDALSSSIVSFFTFFSLPLDAQILKQIRREVLANTLPNSSRSADSTALAASAAFDKGVNLSDEALKEYAAAIDPAGHGDAHSDGGGADSGQASQHNQHRGNGGEDENTPLPDDIKNLMDEIDTDGSLLGYLNKIPGKNGRHWIVLPFNFTSGTIEFSVSLRILIGTKDILHHYVERLALDVLAGDRRWFFLMLREKDASYSGKIAISPEPQKTEQSMVLRELEEILGNFVSNISFMDENALLFFMDSRNNEIISVNEEA